MILLGVETAAVGKALMRRTARGDPRQVLPRILIIGRLKGKQNPGKLQTAKITRLVATGRLDAGRNKL
jgi:hypothetical protein